MCRLCAARECSDSVEARCLDNGLKPRSRCRLLYPLSRFLRNLAILPVGGPLFQALSVYNASAKGVWCEATGNGHQRATGTSRQQAPAGYSSYFLLVITKVTCYTPTSAKSGTLTLLAPTHKSHRHNESMRDIKHALKKDYLWTALGIQSPTYDPTTLAYAHAVLETFQKTQRGVT